MRLRTFLLLLSFILITGLTAAHYYAYRVTKSIVLDHISDWANSTLIQSEAQVADSLNRDEMASIQKILDKAVVTRPYINTFSLSLDGERITYSSDRSCAQKPLKGFIPATRELYRMIGVGQTRFSYPVDYYCSGKQMQAYLLMELNGAYVFDAIISRSMQSTLQSGALFITALLIGTLLFYRFLIRPVNDLFELVKTPSTKPRRYLIRDFSSLYSVVARSLNTLMRQKTRILKALETERYLEAILKTVADINKLLVVSKDRNELLQRGCERLALHGDYHLAWIGFVNDGRVEITHHSVDTTGYLKGGLGITLDPEDPTSKGPAAQSILANQTVLIQNLQNDLSFKPWQDRAGLSHFSAIITLPLRPDLYSEPFGTLAIYTANPEGFKEKEIAMLEELAGDIGFATHAFEQDRLLQLHLSTDTLTSLPNRTMLLDRLAAMEQKEVMLLNINRFRDINDVYGFDAGDLFLQRFAQRLADYIDGFAEVAVYSAGIDSFALLFESGHAIDILPFARDLIHSLESESLEFSGIRIYPSLTAGYAHTPKHPLERAEMALKQAKESKKNIVMFHPEMLMKEAHEENMRWYGIIQDALKDDRIVPYFQGIVDNATGETVKYEALVRLILPDGRVISPAQFLDVAKKSRLYPQLTKKVFTRAIDTFRDSDRMLSINLSIEDILNEEVTELLFESIKREAMGERIIFEILENEGIEDYELVNAFIQRFKTIGCKISIDDFGSGYSNFAHLFKLHIDFLKIDGSLIQNIEHDRNAQLLVQHIHDFAQDMGIETIAEFVSSEAIFEAVKKMGITYSQGYHFHEPVPSVGENDRTGGTDS